MCSSIPIKGDTANALFLDMQCESDFVNIKLQQIE